MPTKNKRYLLQTPSIGVLWTFGKNRRLFKPLATGKTKKWQWTFDGGTPATSNQQNPTVVYQNSGVYDVTLKASNASKNETILKEDFITVHNLNSGLDAFYPFNGNANDKSSNSNNGTITGASLTQDRFGNDNSALSFDGIDDFVNCGTSNRNITETVTISLWVKTSSDAPGMLVTKYDGAMEGTATSSTISHSLINDKPLSPGIMYYGGNTDYFEGIIDDIAIYNRTLTEVEIEVIRLYDF